MFIHPCVRYFNRYNEEKSMRFDGFIREIRLLCYISVEQGFILNVHHASALSSLGVVARMRTLG